MLALTPQQESSAEDRKPRVISEVRKTNVIRSPSLENLARLSGILHYFCTVQNQWKPRFVAIRDGSLLVYSSEKDPKHYNQSATLGRLSKHCFPLEGDSEKQYHTLSRVRCFDSPEKNYYSLDPDYESWQTPRPRFDSCGSMSNLDDSYLSLGRDTPGMLSLRIPLRNLNLRAWEKRANSFSLSRRGDDGTAPVAIFQAATTRDYERWVKTLAVEILRQTPLDAVRFFDVLGAATPSQSQACTVCSNGGYCNLPSCREDLAKSQTKPTVRGRNRTKQTNAEGRIEYESPSIDESRSLKKDIKTKVIEFKYSPLPPRKYDRKSKVQRTLFNNHATQKANSEFYINFDRKIQCNGKMTLLSVDTSHDNHALDEGIVVEDDYEDSSSEQSFGKPSRKSRRESDNSCLESPKSITSHSSFSEAKSSRETLAFDSRKDTDSVDGTLSVEKVVPNSRLDLCNTDVESYEIKSQLVNCNSSWKQSVSAQPAIKLASSSCSNNTHAKDLISNSSSFNHSFDQSDISDEQLDTKSVRQHKYTKNTDINRSTYGRWSWEIENAKKKALSLDSSNRLYARARSASPSKSCVGVQRRVASCSRFGKSSINEDPSESVLEEMNALKIRCQDSDQYVSVREKLALFETLSVMGHRLARSSEDLVTRKVSLPEIITNSKRACSMHDLSEPKPCVPVKEICKFFETIGHHEGVQTDAKEPDRKPIACVVKWKTGEDDYNLNLVKKKNNTQTVKIVNDDFDTKRLLDECDLFENFNYHSYPPIIRGNKIISFV